MKTALLAVSAALVLAACASSPSSTASSSDTGAAGAPATSTAREASVVLAPASGSLVSGRLTAMPMGNGVHFTGEIGGLAPGSTHAIHVHERGDCSAADASSACGHFNPTNQPHGQVGTPTHHAGDMNNLVANAQGVARVDVHAQNVTLGGGAPNDVAGRAVIVHAKADDYRSQPSGDAGARVACGLITAQR
jgi:Cu-Zn family superoxide dismutase